MTHVLSILSGLLLSTTLGASPADDAHPDQRLDHFLCYRAKPRPAPVSLKLHDQFDEKGAWRDARVKKAVTFCNPVAKRDEPGDWKIKKPDHHLAGYRVKVEDKRRRVQIENQITGYHRVDVKLGRPYKLLVPAQKLYPREHPPPVGLDHFLCYKARAPAQKSVRLRDQFMRDFQSARVGRLRALCNPVAKKHRDEHYERLHPQAHLACYRVRVDVSPPRVRYRDQIARGGVELRLKRARTLCVPSRKIDAPYPRY